MQRRADERPPGSSQGHSVLPLTVATSPDVTAQPQEGGQG